MAIQLIIGPDAITSYRRLAYSPWHALAEFVDNSTQSYFDNKARLDEQMQKDEDKPLTVSIVYDKENDLLRVSDNAMGMSLLELEHALHVARPPANTSGRSKYGMGMKTAACWIGDKWTITTKKLMEDMEHSVTVEVKKVANGEPDAVVHTSKPKPADMHYTIVEIVEMNRTFQGRTLGKIGEFLRSMYRSDIQAGVLHLRWRDQLLIWNSMESRLLVDSEDKKYRREFEFDIDGKKVHGWVGILDRGSRADAGFSMLQADRVVRGWPDAWRPASPIRSATRVERPREPAACWRNPPRRFRCKPHEGQYSVAWQSRGRSRGKAAGALRRLPGFCEAQAQGQRRRSGAE